MDKKIYNEVFERSEGLCEVTGGNNMVQLHHIFFGSGRRALCESVETCIMLSWDMHEGTCGVHGREGHELDIRLKKMATQKLLDIGWSKEKIMKKVGRWYLD
jgi:hypothetical protein